jgi:hypothetical protein
MNCPTLNLHEHFKHVFDYIYDFEGRDLYESMEENCWTYEQAMDNHVLGHTLCVAYLLGMLKGGIDEEIQELLGHYGDYRPAPEETSAPATASE